ncbi:aminotransferase class I/II-fold pyridoxal phosphate-dependent enzyme [Desulfosarcina cetonica]|uniref:aminotransferase class I/II-fold pyridoxal phosphate-dependent enzyme n=1 Tax=Desulfosarcina cetonica TaxID=90730 RepID=UPI0006CF7FF7|nr:PLP-dependent aminotransferase family protein [Desulfosarcina cetonica]
MSSSALSPSINFLRGVPAEEALSRLIPMAAAGYEKAILRYGTEVLQYGHFSGFKPLRETIARQHGVDPQRVIVGNGGLEVISLFFKSLPPQSHILVEELTYDRVLSDARRYGHTVSGVRLTDEGVDLEQLASIVADSNVAVFYGIPFHQNPTGINYSEANRKAVERICADNQVVCVWDICYQDLRYDGNLNAGIAISDAGPILTSSFTKTISPGTKCGYMIVPAGYVDHLTQVIANTRINPNLPTQAFIADFIEAGPLCGVSRGIAPVVPTPHGGFERGDAHPFPGCIARGPYRRFLCHADVRGDHRGSSGGFHCRRQKSRCQYRRRVGGRGAGFQTAMAG